MASDFSIFQRGFPYKERTKFNILETQFENGVVQKRNKWNSNQKEFEITFTANTKAEILEIRDYFIAREASENTFTFTDPLESTEYTVRFKDDEFEITRENYGNYNCKVVLIEDL